MSVADRNNQADENLSTSFGTIKEIWRGSDVLWISSGITLIFLAVIVGYRLYEKLALSQSDQDIATTIWLSLGLGLLEGIILVGCVYYLGLRRRNLPWTAVGIRPITSEWLLKGITLGIFAIPLSGLITLIIQLILDLPVNNPQLPFLAPEGFSWPGAVGMVLLGGIAAPFAEEIYFRGVLYTWLRQRWGVRTGILGSSFVFGLVHGNVAIAGAAFFLGLILAWVYERSDSLWPAVLIHVINNSVKIILLYALLASGLIAEL